MIRLLSDQMLQRKRLGREIRTRGIKGNIRSIDGVSQAACVGVGPDGVQVVVVVVVCEKKWSELELHDAVRTVAGVPVAAVLVTKSLPMDIRHNAKLNREKISQWASKKLSGAQ